jgi:hypothetical protein
VADGSFEQLYEEDRQPWEPQGPDDWLKTDPLVQAFRRNEVRIPNSEADAASFHQAWIRMPRQFRNQVAREREVAASLVSFLPSLRDFVPGLGSIGVGYRGREEAKLTGIVTVEERLARPEWSEILKRWDTQKVPRSRVGEFAKVESIPLTVEFRTPLTRLGKVPPDGVLFGEPDPPPRDAPVLQSGDKVGTQSPSGIREFGTLSCFVHYPGTPTPLVLASGHVLQKIGYPLLSNRHVPVRVGKVLDVKDELDVALGELAKPYLCDFRVQGVDIVPGPPVIPSSGMPVQMFGAQSKTQHGYINQGIDIPASATAAGVSTTFTAELKCVHGDSGALLVTGRGSEPAVPRWQRRHMGQAYLDSLTCAILGVLKAGPSRDADPNLRPQGYFVPIIQVLNDLGVEAWVR